MYNRTPVCIHSGSYSDNNLKMCYKCIFNSAATSAFLCLQLIIVLITAKASSAINVACIIKIDTSHKHLEPSDNSNEAGLLCASSQINEAAFSGCGRFAPAGGEMCQHLLLVRGSVSRFEWMMRLRLCARADGGWW